MNRASSATGWVRNPDGTMGWTWNPMSGCLNRTPEGLCLGGMFPCYAFKLANGRLRSRYLANTNYAIPPGKEMPFLRDIMKEKPIQPDTDPFYPRFWCEKLYEPKHKKGSKGIFVCDMSDLFGIGIPQDWTRYVMVNMVLAPQHRFYLLTKQPQNLIKWSPFPENCWVGVTCVDSINTRVSLGELMRVSAKVRFVSFEPLLGSLSDKALDSMRYLDWVIIGAQTKPYKPPKIEWVREITEAAIKVGIPVFHKNNLLPLFEENKAFPDMGVKLRQDMPESG